MSENLEGEGDVMVASHAHCVEAIPLHDCFEIREFDSMFQSIHGGGSSAEYLVSSRRPTFRERTVHSRSSYPTSVN